MLPYRYFLISFVPKNSTIRYMSLYTKKGIDEQIKQGSEKFRQHMIQKYNNKINTTLKNQTKTIEKLENISNKIIDKLEKNDFDQKHSIVHIINISVSKIKEFYGELKIIMTQYKYAGLITYFGIWGIIVSAVYIPVSLQYIDYHNWSFLHLPQIENKLKEYGKSIFDIDLTINRTYEDILASILISKCTKIFQWYIVIKYTKKVSNLLKIK